MSGPLTNLATSPRAQGAAQPVWLPVQGRARGRDDRGIQVAIEGNTTVSPAMVATLITRLREQRRRDRAQSLPKPPPLTRREGDVLRLLAQVRENSAIAAERFISRATVKTHVTHVLDKLGLDNRVQAAVFAVRHRIVYTTRRSRALLQACHNV